MCSARAVCLAVALGVAALIGFAAVGGDDPPPLRPEHEPAASAVAPAVTAVLDVSQAPRKRGVHPSLDDINPSTADGTESQAARDKAACPAFRFRGSKTADAKHNHEAMVKYTRYVHQYCNSTGMLQMHVGLETYLGFLDTVARIVKMAPGARVFDWGCGCGTMLNYYHLRYNTTGVGIDITEAAVLHARAHAQPQQTFCFMDGADLRHFASDSFDAVVSWATLYHVRRTLVQCEIVHQLVRMLRPGGIAYIGHLRTEKTQEYWRKKHKCVIPNATIARLRDHRTFHMPSFKRNAFFSLVVTKRADTHNATEPSPAAHGGGGGGGAEVDE